MLINGFTKHELISNLYIKYQKFGFLSENIAIYIASAELQDFAEKQHISLQQSI